MRRLKTVIIVMLITLLLTVLMVGCGGNKTQQQSGGDTGKKYTLKITHVMDNNHHYQKGAEKFKELVEKKTNGQVQVQIYPSGQLGAERAILEGMQMGTIEMGIVTSGALSNFVPEFAVLDIGYLFKDNKQAQQVLNGEVGKTLMAKMDQVGIHSLGWLDVGFRSVYAKKAITKPEDLKGLKIRTMENPAHIALFKSLGANPIPVNWNELYTSLQQGVVDAAENVVDVYYNSKQYEVAPYFSETNHVYLVVGFMISKSIWDKLPADIQQAIQESATEAIKYENSVFEQQKTEAYEKLKAAKVTITPITDLAPFQNLAKQSWADVAKKIPNGDALLEQIKKATGN
ncbi:Solute-binding protein [Moorella humiferrea]|uniref:TRAP transporter substrate-binding protein n=1 Tax=Neomoorella humiferrea TaxID=676965 RepID=UPI0030D4CD08